MSYLMEIPPRSQGPWINHSGQALDQTLDSVKKRRRRIKIEERLGMQSGQAFFSGC